MGSLDEPRIYQTIENCDLILIGASGHLFPEGDDYPEWLIHDADFLKIGCMKGAI